MAKHIYAYGQKSLNSTSITYAICIYVFSHFSKRMNGISLHLRRSLGQACIMHACFSLFLDSEEEEPLKKTYSMNGSWFFEFSPWRYIAIWLSIYIHPTGCCYIRLSFPGGQMSYFLSLRWWSLAFSKAQANAARWIKQEENGATWVYSPEIHN